MTNMKNDKSQNREAWLMQAVEFFAPLFKSAKFPLPPVRVSTGWTKSKACKALGECWHPDAADDKRPAIFISPALVEAEGEQGVLSVLVHELCHAADGNKSSHGPGFKKIALAVGLEGPMRATVSGPRLNADIKLCVAKIGKYPHSALHLGTAAGEKKQSTRMIKCECEECGYVVRTARKWIIEVGAPHCPKHGAMGFEMPEDERDETDED